MTKETIKEITEFIEYINNENNIENLEKEASTSKNKEYIINIIWQYYGMSDRAKAFFR